MKYKTSLIVQFLPIMISSIVVGAGIGFFQGFVVFSVIEFKFEIEMSAIASLCGAMGGIVIGFIIFFVHIYRRIEFVQFTILISVALFVGSTCGLIMNALIGPGSGWFSMWVTLFVAAIGAIYLRSKNIIDFNDNTTK